MSEVTKIYSELYYIYYYINIGDTENSVLKINIEINKKKNNHDIDII